MRIFVTVGTTPFDSLIKYIDQVKIKELEIIMQISHGNYRPSNYSFFTFDKNIEKFYKESDIVITHAGAGTIYKLLEMNKKIIVFPNSERKDLHQFDIAKYVYRNNYGLLGTMNKDFYGQIRKVYNSKYTLYKKIDFFAFDLLKAPKDGLCE